jgi:hypothetical protein
MKSLSLILLAFLLISTTCNRDDQVAAYARMVKQADEIRLYLLDPFPTSQADQEAAQKYLADFRILEEVKMSKEEQRELRRALEDTEQFLTKNIKSCPFVARYGIQLTRKKAWMEVIVSRSSCPKVMFKSSYAEEPEHADLKPEGVMEYLSVYSKTF